MIIDFSVYQLKWKIEELNKADSQKRQRTCTWCPDYLVTDEHQVATLDEVCQSLTPCLVHYERVPKLEADHKSYETQLQSSVYEGAWHVLQHITPICRVTNGVA